MIVHNQHCEPWKVSVVDTGLNTMTGGRVKRIQPYVGNEAFMLTYGDGVSDVNIQELLAFHKSHGKIATITSVMFEQTKGFLDTTSQGQVLAFREKSNLDGARINGGYMVLEPEVFNYLGDDTTVFEKGPMERLAADGQLMAYKHEGFWQCMDTKREMEKLEDLLHNGTAPWKVWED